MEIICREVITSDELVECGVWEDPTLFELEEEDIRLMADVLVDLLVEEVEEAEDAS